MAGRFRVVTDSTSDVSREWCQRYGIEVVPLRVLFGSDDYRDGVDLSTAEFFTRLARAERLPTTSAPSPGDFATAHGGPCSADDLRRRACISSFINRRAPTITPRGHAPEYL